MATLEELAHPVWWRGISDEPQADDAAMRLFLQCIR